MYPIDRGGQLLREAQRWICKSGSVSKVVRELIASKRNPPANKKSASEKYLADMESRLGRFEDAFHCNIADIQPKQIEEFLNKPKNISGRTRFNNARMIHTPFNFAKGKRYLPQNIDPMEGIEIEFDDDGEIEIFTPEEAKRLFAVVRPELTPFLAIACFAGVRHSEIQRLDWKHITTTHIEMRGQ